MKFYNVVFITSLFFGAGAHSNSDVKESIIKEVRDEIEMGREMAARLLGLMPSTEDKKVVEYVNLIGQSLAERSSRPELKFRFAVLKHDEVNAFATPGGYIFVTEALLKAIRTEGELAGVLGHEIAHVTERHMYHELVPKRSVSVEDSVVRFVGGGASDLARSFTAIVEKGMKTLLEDGFSPEKEKNADEVGVFYAAAAGYNSNGLMDFLKFSQESKEKLKLNKNVGNLSDRIGNLEKVMVANGFNKVTKPDNKERFSSYLAVAPTPQK